MPADRAFLDLLANVPRLFALLWAASPALTVGAAAVSLANAVVAPAQIWFTKVVIDRVLASLEQGGAVDWAHLLAPIAALGGVWALGAACASLSTLLRMLLGIRSQQHVRFVILQRAARLDLAFFETPECWDRLENALNETGRAHDFAWFLFGWISDVLSLAAVMALLARIHPAAVLVLALTSAPQVLLQGRSAAGFWGRVRQRSEARRTSQYYEGLLMARETAREVRLFGLADQLLERLRSFWELFYGDDRQHRVRMAGVDLLGLLSVGGMASIWAYAVYRAALGQITVGDVALALQAAEQARARLGSAFRSGAQGYERVLYASNLFEFFDRDWTRIDGALERTAGVAVPPLRTGIEFRQVTFAYPGAAQPVLREVSFTIPAGQTVAVVGPNGAGKTTLVKLLCRFYDPASGSVRVDGVDLRHLRPEDWWARVGVTFQDFVKYDLTVRDNVGFGRLEALEDGARLDSALDRGGARSLVERLPHGVDTQLGRTFSGGVDLSGGEWQTLALSRAYFRDAELLILDEPTAALDALAELDVYRCFAQLTAGRTTVLISHRFSTVRMADHILVLDGGRLVEEGSHEALLGRGGHYARMFNAQAERYR